MIFNVTGFSHMKGVSKRNNKPYEMARLFRLAELRAWQNDNGCSRVAGYQTDDQTAFDVFTGQERVINDLLLIKYPCELDLTFEPHPEDPTRNIVTGFKTVKEDKNPLG